MAIKKAKVELRTNMLSQRQTLDNSAIAYHSYNLCEKLKSETLKLKAKTVHTFLPMSNEVDLYPFIRWCLNTNITVITTKTLKNRTLKHLVLHSLSDLTDGVFGTKHPATEEEHQGDIDIIIVPGLAFDNSNMRLGYGGGYYDTFLVNHPKAIKIGVGFPFQLIDQVPVEEHDVRLNRILI